MPKKSTVKKSFSMSPSFHRFGIRSVIILTPIMIILAFSFAYMQYQTTSLQRAVAKTKVPAITSSEPALPLVSQPKLPELNNSTGTDASTDTIDSSVTVPGEQVHSGHNSNVSNTPATSVGPASSQAGSTLQPVGEDNGSEINHSLQATRDSIKFEDLHL